MIFIRRQPLPYYTASSSGPYFAWHHAHRPFFPEDRTDDTNNNKAPQPGQEANANAKEKSDENKDNSRVVYRGVDSQMVEVNGTLSIFMDLPGVKPSDVSIEMEDNVMQVEGKRMSGQTVAAKYVRRFHVDGKSVDVSGITASMADGVLTIKAPKKATAEPVTLQLVSEYPPESGAESLVVVSLDVPGVKSDDLKVVYRDNDIIDVQGERTRGRFTTKLRRHYAVDENEIDVGSFKAYLADGVLTVTALANDEKTQNKKISILVTTETSTQRSKQDDDEVVLETVREEDEATEPMGKDDEVVVETVVEEDETTGTRIMGNHLQSDGKDKDWEQVE